MSKNDPILSGLRDLCEQTPPGRTLSAKEIAKHCGCSKRYITKIQTQAIEKLRELTRAREGRG